LIGWLRGRWRRTCAALENVVSSLRRTGQGRACKGKLEVAGQGVEGEQARAGALGFGRGARLCYAMRCPISLRGRNHVQDGRPSTKPVQLQHDLWKKFILGEKAVKLH
jgi:hypothetical protein